MPTRGCGALPRRFASTPPPRSDGRPSPGGRRTFGPSTCSSCDASGSWPHSRPPHRNRTCVSPEPGGIQAASDVIRPAARWAGTRRQPRSAPSTSAVVAGRNPEPRSVSGDCPVPQPQGAQGRGVWCSSGGAGRLAPRRRGPGGGCATTTSPWTVTPVIRRRAGARRRFRTAEARAPPRTPHPQAGFACRSSARAQAVQPEGNPQVPAGRDQREQQRQHVGRHPPAFIPEGTGSSAHQASTANPAGSRYSRPARRGRSAGSRRHLLARTSSTRFPVPCCLAQPDSSARNTPEDARTARPRICGVAARARVGACESALTAQGRPKR